MPHDASLPCIVWVDVGGCVGVLLVSCNLSPVVISQGALCCIDESSATSIFLKLQRHRSVLIVDVES